MLVRCILMSSLWIVRVYKYVFFFKQKTAYEMRISDWSSDVCSSDLKMAWHVARYRQRAKPSCQLLGRVRHITDTRRYWRSGNARQFSDRARAISFQRTDRKSVV